MGLFDGTSLERPVTCERCDKPMSDCDCPRNAAGKVCEAKDQQARVRREKRRGQWVTVVYQLDPVATDLKALLKDLKKACAAGGSVNQDGIQIQGDHKETVVKHLLKLGYAAKTAGG